MSIRHIELALKVAEEKSFTKAADKLGISQPSLSKSIMLLEKDLGVEIFDRKNGLSLTYAGEIYISKAKNLIRIHNEMNDEIKNLSTLKTGKLNIGVTQVSYGFLDKIFPVFYARFSKANIKLIQTFSEIGLFERLENNEIDIAFSIHFDSMKQENLNYETIKKTRLYIAMPKTSRLASQLLLNSTEKYPKISLRMLKDEKFILSDKKIRLKTGFENIFQKAGFEPQTACITDNIETAILLVASGIGTAFAFEAFLRDDTKDFIALFDVQNEPLLDISLSVAYKKDKNLSKLAKEFIKTAKAG